MNKEIFVANVDELADGDVKQVVVEGMCLAAYRVGEEVYVTSNVCTHGHALMSDGYLEGYEIECPLHQGRFDIRTGAPTCVPAEEPIKIFPVNVVDGKVYLKVSAGEPAGHQVGNLVI